MSQSPFAESPGSKTRRSWTVISAFTCLLALAGVFCSRLEAADIPTVEQIRRQTVSFTENRGQWDSQVLYRAASSGATMWFTKDGIYYQFTRLKHDQATNPVEQIGGIDSQKFEQMMIKSTFADANANVQVTNEGLMEYKCNYFFGNDSTRWQTNVPNYTAITFRNLYAGIDLKFEAGIDGMESHFIVSPGADLEQMRLQFEGADSISVNSAGDLIINSRWGELVERTADIFQDSSGSRDNYSGNYELVDEQTVRFAVDDSYDASRELFLAPTLTFSTYLGGSVGESPADRGIETNSLGETILVGSTTSADFPTVNASDITQALKDGFVTKFNASGTGLLSSTYLGGSSDDYCTALRITASVLPGIIVIGGTYSSDFPMVNAVDASANGAPDCFLVAFGGDDGSGGNNGISFSTYLGGSFSEYPSAMAVQCVPPCNINQYTVWVTGHTQSTNFPTSNAYNVALSGPSDAFLTEFTIGVSGNSMGRSTYFGGSYIDHGAGVIIVGGAANRPIVTGTTQSTDFPLVNPFDATYGGADAFLAGFDYAGNGQMFPTFSTYYGGSDFEEDLSIVARSSGNLVIAGSTTSTDLPISAGYDNSHNGNYDGFIAEFNSNGSSLVFNTYLGGTGYDRLYGGLALDLMGNIYVTGYTQSTDFPTVNPYDTSLAGTGDAFIAKFNSTATNLEFSTLLGGSGIDQGTGITVDAPGCLYVAGSTSSSNFPVANPYDPTLNGSDAFLTKICLQTHVCGDADGSAIVTISDAVLLINYIFAGGPAPNPLLSGDADCSGSVTISDAVYLINYIFAGGAAPCASCP